MKTGPLWLSGSMICALMRKHQVTIASLAAKFTLTKMRVREVRAKGVTGFLAEEWMFMITGQWPGVPVPAFPKSDGGTRQNG